MKIIHFACFTLLSLAFFSCNKTDSLGLEIQPQGDKIATVTDTFHLSSKDSIFGAISAQCLDSMSMLLGEYYDEKYGSVKADLVVQIAPPVNYVFPSAAYNVKADSLVLYMFYKQYFGVANEPFEVSIYELNKSTPDYNKQYLTNFDVTSFLDINNQQLLGKKVMTSVDKSLTEKQLKNKSYVPAVKYFFDSIQIQRFMSIPHSAYGSIESFLQKFKGLYITTSYGKSSMLYLFEVDLRLFYHYSYKTKLNGKDTTMTVKTFINYPASKDVRQLNHITQKNLTDKINKRDSVTYITTSSGIYPKITLPISRIKQRIKDSVSGKNLKREIFINSAVISLESTELDSSATAKPVPTALLMIPVSEADNFIKNNSLKIVQENKAQIATYNIKKREYIVDIAHLLSKIIKNDSYTEANAEFLLIPVDLYKNTKGSIVECRPTKRLGANTIRSGKSKFSPLRLELTYSGF